MRTMKRILAILLVAATAIALLPAALTASAAGNAPALIITEVCFNPAFRENTADLGVNEDVLEYVEIYNRSNADVSIADCVMRYAKGYSEESYSQNAIFAVSDNPRVIKAGETAIFVCYQATSATLGYGYKNDAEIKAYYDLFCDFYGCSETVSLHNFYVIPRVESGTSKKIEGGFNLANSHEAVVLTLVRGNEVLAECAYNSALWNKNDRGLNMIWQEGMDPDHPMASAPFSTAGCNPGYIYANQVPNAALTAPEGTMPIKAMAYNLQAEAKDQTAADGTAVPDAMRTEKIFETIDAHDPDVLVLTEINYRWLNLLDGELIGEGGEYSAYGRSSMGRYHDKTQTGEIWDLTTLVLWKTEKYDLIEQGTFWCSKMPNRPGSLTWDDGLSANMARAINWVILEDKATGARFLFVGVHLDARTPEVRERSTALLVEMSTELAQGLPIIAMGDYNCSDNAAAYWNIHDTNLYDARYLIPTYGNMTILGTYNKFGENTDMQVRLPIDLCFVTPETVWVDSARVDYAFVDEGDSVYASDHNAVIFELQLKPLHAEEPETEIPTESPTEPETDPETEPVTDPVMNPETEPVAHPETAPVDTVEVTEASTDAPTDPITDAPTEAPTAAPTDPVTNATEEIDPPENGCGSVLSALTLLTVLPAVLCLLRKKREE